MAGHVLDGSRIKAYNYLKCQRDLRNAVIIPRRGIALLGRQNEAGALMSRDLTTLSGIVITDN